MPARAGPALANSSPTLLDFVIDGNGRAVGADENAVVFLLAVGSAAPLPVLDGISTVADGLPGHVADLAFEQRRVGTAPVDEGGLGFHHPEIFVLVAAGEVVGGAVGEVVVVVGVDVVVPGGDVEDGVDGVLVEAVEPAHGVGGDELARVSVGTDGGDLVFGVALPGVADEALPIEQECGVLAVLADGDLVEVVVGLRSSRRWPSDD